MGPQDLRRTQQSTQTLLVRLEKCGFIERFTPFGPAHPDGS